MKFFEGMEHVETVKIHYPGCTRVETSIRHHAVKENKAYETITTLRQSLVNHKQEGVRWCELHFTPCQ